RTLVQALAFEARTAHQLSGLALHSWRLLSQPRGDGHPVLVVPGYGQSDSSTALLRRYLKRLGYRVRGWQQGANSGSFEVHARGLLAGIRQLAEEGEGGVSLVGWSMGGVFARELARDQPRLIRQVITLGSPVTGGPKYTAFAARMRQSGVDLDAIENHLARHQQGLPKIRVPVTAIYSRRDGIVAWQACIDQVHHHVDHVEVDSSHIGLGYSADVYRVIARRLARPAGGG